MLDVVDNLTSDVTICNFFDSETWGSVYFENKRATAGAHQVDTGDMETHRAGGFYGKFFLNVGEFNWGAETAFVEV